MNEESLNGGEFLDDSDTIIDTDDLFRADDKV